VSHCVHDVHGAGEDTRGARNLQDRGARLRDRLHGAISKPGERSASYPADRLSSLPPPGDYTSLPVIWPLEELDSTVSAPSEDPNVVVRPSGSFEVLGGSERPTIIEQFISHLVRQLPRLRISNTLA
jgi:hypothetical protein